MKSPRYKSGGILNRVCAFFLMLYGRLVYKYVYKNDFWKYYNRYHIKHTEALSDKIDFSNIRRRK